MRHIASAASWAAVKALAGLGLSASFAQLSFFRSQSDIGTVIQGHSTVNTRIFRDGYGLGAAANRSDTHQTPGTA